MSDTEIILLFKRNNEMSDKDWNLLCERYANRNISTIMRFLRDMCEEEGIPVSKTLSETLAKEMRERKLCYAHKRMSVQ